MRTERATVNDKYILVNGKKHFVSGAKRLRYKSGAHYDFELRIKENTHFQIVIDDVPDIVGHYVIGFEKDTMQLIGYWEK